MMLLRAIMTDNTKPQVTFCFVLVILMSSQPIEGAKCPPGWLEWRQSCYLLLPDKMNWYEAMEACDRPGLSGLAAPNSPDENDFIWHSIVKNTDGLWIACTDVVQEGVWVCGGQPLTFSSWFGGNPRNDTHLNCARVTVYGAPARGLWADDVACGSANRKQAACEMTVAAVQIYHTYTGPDGRVPQECLHHHDIKNVTVESLLTCGWACRADPRCRSFNLWLITKGKICQLNDITRLGADGADFKATNNCFYFNL
ncbi:C-type lectin lectoxin-Enh6-like [Acanthaster planci]|uniref:C-type lectin lectoxin-Enh6-like n=1 Tax=Acanthaster planci TaxID=133434 RepID=A0A8B7ZEQ8_ACAPL|nr:C-type lectin lectoxin-Enh6-like [Acanthaster planci]